MSESVPIRTAESNGDNGGSSSYGVVDGGDKYPNNGKQLFDGDSARKL